MAENRLGIDSVVYHALVATCREMALSITRVARSSLIRDVEDFSTAILDRDGRMVAQAETIPIHLNSLEVALQSCLLVYPRETWGPSDVVFNNDPYSGGQHLPDLIVFRAIHGESGEILGFVGCIAHQNDLGGGLGSLNPHATDLHEEGLIIPPVMVDTSGDWLSGAFGRVLVANSRTPAAVSGDVQTQVTATAGAVQRIRALARRYGPATVTGVMAATLESSERDMRAVLAALPDGEHSGVDYLDDDGKGSGPLRIAATVRLHADQLTIDFSGTAPQAPSFVNSTYAATVSAAHTAVKAFLGESRLRANAGTFRPVQVIIPPGSLLNPDYPAPVRARVNAACRAYNAVLRALNGVDPERASASGFDSVTCVNLGHCDEHGRFRILVDPLRGGFGATAFSDGESALSQIMSNAKNTPVEIVESDMPFLRIVRYEIARGSGGAGRQSGGNGVLREYQALCDGVNVTFHTGRQVVTSWGWGGGADGAVARLRVDHGDGWRELAVAGDAVTLNEGDVLEVTTGGGGGFGAPDES